MNDQFGTAKLMWLAKDQPSAKRLLANTLAIRLGTLSSSVLLLDTKDANKLLILQVTYTDSEHTKMCLDFLASGEEKSRLAGVFVNRRPALPAEFRQRLPELVGRLRPIDYADQVAKSAPLLFDLSESKEDLFYSKDEGRYENMDAVKQADRYSWVLVDACETGAHITELDAEGRIRTDNLPEALQNELVATKRKLAELLKLLPEDLNDEFEAHQNKTEGLDERLGYWLHNSVDGDLPEGFASQLPDIVRPALNGLAEAIKTRLAGAGDASNKPATIFALSDCLFCSQACRAMFLEECLTDDCLQGCGAVYFVKDAGLLGFLGALQTKEGSTGN